MTLSNRLAAYLARHNVHYGWIVAGTTFLTMLSCAAAVGSAGVLVVPLQTEFGWTNAEVSSALAVRLVLFGLLGPFAVAFMNHFGIRNIVACALLLIAGGTAGSVAMTEFWQLVLFAGVVVGVGAGMTALVLGAMVATRWFNKRRGFVVGLLSASNATGQLIFLPLFADVTERIGWRAGQWLVVAMMVSAILLVLLLVRDNPADLGLSRYGDAPGTRPATPTPRGSLVAMLMSPLIVLLKGFRSFTFWVLFLTFFICGFSTNGLIQTHWIAVCGDFGVAPVGAAYVLAIIGIGNLFGAIISGWLSDRYDNRWLLFWFYGLRGLSLLYLPFSDFSLYELSLFAVFFGLDWVATVPPTVKLAVERFGAEQGAIIFGWVFTGHQLGAAAAAYFAGAVRTGFETYLPAFYTAGLLCFVAAAMILFLNRPAPTPTGALQPS